jgi:hypothetical protein
MHSLALRAGMELRPSSSPVTSAPLRVLCGESLCSSEQRPIKCVAPDADALSAYFVRGSFLLRLLRTPLTSCAALYSSSCVESGDVAAVGRRMSRARSKRFSGPIRPLTSRESADHWRLACDATPLRQIARPAWPPRPCRACHPPAIATRRAGTCSPAGAARGDRETAGLAVP